MSGCPNKRAATRAPTQNRSNQKSFASLVYAEAALDREWVSLARETAGRNHRLNRATRSSTASGIVEAELVDARHGRGGG
jgi:hypothetical protein